MILTTRTIVLAFVCSLAACTSAATAPPPAPEPAAEATTVSELSGSPEEAPQYIARAVLAPTPAMLKAALSNDPDAMRDAATSAVAGCHDASTCPAQFGSCTSWSTTTLCNETCGVGVCICKPIIQCGGEPPETKGRDTFNSFRICFDSSQNPCTEWTNTSSTFCGC
jgi:hypothetical protein